jgi:cephalosporin hydroxylase
MSDDAIPMPRWAVEGVSDDAGIDEEDADRIVRQFHDLYCQNRDRTWRGNTSWLGVGVIKCPLDLWVYQEILFSLRPDLIIETGTLVGGSAYFIASMCDLIGKGRVITIDVESGPGRPNHPRITYLTGSSVDPDIVATVEQSIAPGEKVLVLLDSWHQGDHVLQEMRAYSPFVTEDSYLIVEDTNINSWRPRDRVQPGPLEAVREFLRDDDRFEIDRSWEKFFMTFNPSGFLRRRGPG